MIPRTPPGNPLQDNDLTNCVAPVGNHLGTKNPEMGTNPGYADAPANPLDATPGADPGADPADPVVAALAGVLSNLTDEQRAALVAALTGKQ